jgi:hypothetical protein
VDPVADTPANDIISAQNTVASTEIIEIFIDSLHIGEVGKTKVEIIIHRIFDNVYVARKFYTKGPDYWYHQNTYMYECTPLVGLDVTMSDFTNDKYNDLTFVSAIGARGANEIRRLFLYDHQEKKLVSV